ncbi:tetratricopeptide repeat protein [Desulfogranum mediterraneum]|uniref:tetratricopeptide repeat protein n=1 Tax=Desulfogranum mediterraneum TaxID=160661 RepID=UPI0003FEAA3B|nr:tetratricopeptide repeat protein [Desulfogranum mediterraneum]
MAEQNVFDKKTIEVNTMAEPEGLLEQFNLPPGFIAFVRKHSKLIWSALICATAVVVAVSLYGSYRSYTLNKAASALDQALQEPDQKRSRLETVIREYGSTPSALWAKVELMKMHEQHQEMSQAITLLEQLESESSLPGLLKPLVTSKLAGLYERENMEEQALAAFKALSAMQGFEGEAYRGMGRVNETLGRTDQAVANYRLYIQKLEENGASVQGDPTLMVIKSRLHSLEQLQ